MFRKLINTFLEVTDHMQYGDYARIAMIETLTNLAEKSDMPDFFWDLREEIVKHVE